MQLKTLAIGACVAFGLSATTKAAVIDLSAFGWMAQTDPGLDLTILSTSNNGVTLALEKFADFTAPANADGTITPLTIVFQQIAPGAVPRIAIDDETVINDTGTPWDGFLFSITGGAANNGVFPGFDIARSASFSIAPFADRAYSADGRDLVVTGGEVATSVFPDNLFRPGRTAGQLVIDAEPFVSGGTLQSFSFVEQPTTDLHPFIAVPEPSSACLAIVAIGMVATRRASRRGR